MSVTEFLDQNIFLIGIFGAMWIFLWRVFRK